MHFNSKKYRLLLICPLLPMQERISSILKKAQYRVECIQEEDKALLQIKESQPDLILLAPAGSTPAECKIISQLRNKVTTRTTPIIFISSIKDDSIIAECLNFDYTDFLTKPLREKELLLRVKHQLLLLEATRTIRRQNERLQETIEARDKLYSVIAHDLRAPIGTIKMINSIIESQKDKIRNAGIRKKFEMINETTEQAFNLLENLLRWSRNLNGKTKVVRSNFDLAISIREVLSLFTAIAKSKNINLVNSVKKPVFVYADEDMIKTVLRNLISNAIKFTYPGGEVSIMLTEYNEQVSVAVKDNGQGIKKENQSKLLKDGQLCSTYGTKNEKGCGLGLLLSCDFIKLNKGKLRFKSKEGEGTIFYFTIPSSTDFPGKPLIDSLIPHTSVELPRHP